MSGETEKPQGDEKGRVIVRFVVYEDKTLLPPGIEPFIYDEAEITRLGNGDIVEGFKRLQQEVLQGGRSIEEIRESGVRPLQDELDLLPPPFGIQPERLN